jgi:hypothetical protein
LKKSSDVWFTVLPGPERPNFVAQACADLGIETGLRRAVAAALLFSTVADGPMDHDRGVKTARPAHRQQAGIVYFQTRLEGF